MKTELPLSLKLIRGAIGKEFVIKHYKYGAVKTKYPDMSGVVASMRQRKCRNLFRDAVAYAKEVVADTGRKNNWQKKLRKPNGVYNAAIKEYMLREKKAKQRELLVTNRLLRNAMMNIKEENSIALNNFNSTGNILFQLEIKNLALSKFARLSPPAPAGLRWSKPILQENPPSIPQ